MVEIFEVAPELEKLATEEGLSKSERKEIEDKLCVESDDFIGCAVELRNVMLQVERGPIKNKGNVRAKITEVLEDYGAIETSSRIEEDRQEVEQLEEIEESAGELKEQEAGEVEDKEAKLENEIFMTLGSDKLTANEIARGIDDFNLQEIQQRLYVLLADFLLEQGVTEDGSIAYYDPNAQVEEQQHEEEEVDAEKQQRVLETMKETSSDPQFVEEMWNMWEDADISGRQFQERMFNKFGEDEYKEIRESVEGAI